MFRFALPKLNQSEMQLIAAARAGKLDEVTTLLHNGADVNASQTKLVKPH